MSALDVLIGAKSLLETMGWCQGWQAKDSDGHQVNCEDGRAASLCSLASIFRVANGADGHRDMAIRYFGEAVGGGGIGRWNDHPARTKAEVLCAFDRAIKLARADL